MNNLIKYFFYGLILITSLVICFFQLIILVNIDDYSVDDGKEFVFYLFSSIFTMILNLIVFFIFKDIKLIRVTSFILIITEVLILVYSSIILG
ncbi:MAG: hypothetical protein COA32_13750 [Fluviicola sp.]|nr:MAG: hypothetical protein COA32_13750 [Fluviicola sp.]